MQKTTAYSTLLTALFFALAGCTAETTEPPADTAATPEQDAADLVLVNGAIYTVDPARSWAQAVAIAGDRIVYVGSDEGAREAAATDARVVDLGGRMVLPGLHDVHIHPIGGGMEALACDLNALTTLEQYLERIAECAVDAADEPWILGGGWLMSVFGPGGAASRKLLDEIEPDRPIYLTSSDGHSAWVNSKALEVAGITADTPDPEDGIIDRESGTNIPLGSLQEGAMYLVAKRAPEATLESRTAGLKYSIDMLNGYGITSIQDAYVFEPDLAAYRALDERGELYLRAVTSLWWERDQGVEQLERFRRQRDAYTTGNVRATTVKIMQDGVMENYTAAMLEPYIGQGGAKGIPMVDPELLKTAVTELDEEGFQVHFHAIGDAAIRQCLDAVEAAVSANGNRGNRHHISHLQLIDPADVPRFRELGVVANFQPLWAYSDEYITDLTIPFIGEERGRSMYVIGSVYRSGGMVAFGSDWSVSSANPYWQIETAITRLGALGETTEPLVAEEAISLPEAIEAFTIAGAYVNGSEDRTGSVEVGKFADLVVLDRNLFAIETEEISEASAVLTLFGGKPVFGEFADL